MCNGLSKRQLCLMNRLRQLWGQHVYWTRFFIISTADQLEDLQTVTDRLLQNPKDFSRLLKPVYGAKAACQFQELFTQHLLIGADLVNAVKDGDQEKASCARKKWYENADQIACFLAAVNRCWQAQRWKDMLYSHLEMTEQEAALRLQGDHAGDLKTFGAIERDAMCMADYMFWGMVRDGFC